MIQIDSAKMSQIRNGKSNRIGDKYPTQKIQYRWRCAFYAVTVLVGIVLLAEAPKAYM